ncbi:MAG: polysaccharide biosynthesis protein [Clostridiales Family XIII bacterium]|jgi:stage V sporulation protein B|nr:polysaccharide biosynthesis protein [Clostridiales Family XIII bacterium]
MTKKTFMRGAVILAAAGVIIKAMGAVFRIPLANMIGEQGMAYYQAAYPIYVLFLTLSTAGVPVAISRMVSERIALDRPEAAHRVFRVSFILLFCIGIASFSICFFGADFILNFFNGMKDAGYALRAIAPALLFVPMMAAYRGYFQGMQDMRPTAASQVVEQFFRVLTGLSLAWALFPRGESFAAAGASFGASAGAIGGLILVMAIYGARRKRAGASGGAGYGFAKPAESADAEPARDILVKIFVIAVPITIGAAIMPIMNAIDLAIVTNRLTATGWTEEAARGLYGLLTGFANPLINLPQVLTQAVAMSLVPAVAAAYKREDMEFLRHNVRLGLRTAVIVGLPCAFGMMVLSEQIMLLFYPADRDAAYGAASCLSVLAFGIIFLSTIQTLTGVLQGVGHQMIPVRNLFIGAVVKVAVTYVLTGLPEINVRGAAIGTVAAYVIAAALNVSAVRKYTGTKFNISLTYVKPAVSALTMSVAAWAVYSLSSAFFGNSVSTVLSVALGVAVYAVMLFVSKSITREELVFLPKGEKLAAFLEKAGGKRKAKKL